VSDPVDQESKTEQATEKRLRDAQEKGDVPQSKEVVIFGSIVSMLAAFTLLLGNTVFSLFSLLAADFGRSGSTSIETRGDTENFLAKLTSDIAFTLLPLLLVIAAGGIVGSIAQNMPSSSFERLNPKWDRLSPSANGAQIFGKNALVELATTSVKILVAATVGWYIATKVIIDILPLVVSEIAMLLVPLKRSATSILTVFAMLCLLIAIIDVTVVRTNWLKKMMMTKQEVKDELKQSEGDQQTKGRMKLLGRRRLNSRMMANLPQSTMVVVNPTHYAVAMRYVATESGAPVVIAKGMDHLALKIRNICEENRIPVIENAILARSLHQSVEVGAVIPVEFYKAVAEVVHFVELRKRLRPDLSRA
jgi:flagellar biosynthesis protein FlhB